MRPFIAWVCVCLVLLLGLPGLVRAQQVSGLTLSPASVSGGQTVLATATLSSPVPMTGGQAIFLTSNNPAVAVVGANVGTIAGDTSVMFVVDTLPLPSPTPTPVTVTITAKYGATGTPFTAPLSVTFVPAQTLAPPADSYIQGGSSADTNYGSLTSLIVKRDFNGSASAGDRATYLKFDLTNVKTAPDHAFLKLNFQAAPNPPLRNMLVNVYSVSDTTWTETGLTWNNAPGLNRTDFSSTGTYQTQQNVRLILGVTAFDVTSYVAANLGKVITLQLIAPVLENSGVVFNSKEATSGKPNLTLLYSSLVVNELIAPGWAEGSVPFDSAGASGSGPSSADAVNLATGAYGNLPGADIAVRNPVGPSAAYGRRYSASRALNGYGSPGLSPGWTDNYDISLLGSPGAWNNPLILTYPNGGKEALTPPASVVAGGTYTLTPGSGVASGAPYLVTLTAPSPLGAAGRWASITMTSKDESKLVFLPVSGSPDAYLLRQIVNKVGRLINISYDASLRLTSIVNDASQSLLTFAYDSGTGLLKSVTDGYGRQVAYTFGANVAGYTCLSSVSQIVAAGTLNPATQWGYGYAASYSRPLLTSVGVPDPTGVTTNLVSQTITYDAALRVGKLTDANLNQRVYTYNASTNVQVNDSTGLLTQQWTQQFGGIVDTGTTDAASHSSMVAYGDLTNFYQPTSVTNRNSQTSTLTYDAFGNTLTASTPSNDATLTATSTYDYMAFALGRLTSVQAGSKTVDVVTYYPNGLVQTVRTPRPGTQGTGEQVTTTYTYTALGNVATISSPSPDTSPGRVITYTYAYTGDGTGRTQEVLGEPLTLTDPLGHVTHYRYDTVGNLTTVIDAAGNTTDYTYSSDTDQLKSILYPATGQTGVGRAHTDYFYRYPGGPLTTIKFFDEGNNFLPVRTINLGKGSEGQDTATSGAVMTTSTGYDALFRPKTLGDGNNHTKGLGYDAVGNLNALSYNTNGNMGFGFDNDQNLTSRTNGLGQNTTYDRSGTNDSRVKAIHYNGTAPDVSFLYDAFDRITLMTDGTGSTAYDYDDLDNITQITTFYSALPAGSNTFTTQYHYNNDGSRNSMTVSGGGKTYTYNYLYDDAGNLTNVSSPWLGGNYSYLYYANDWLMKQTASRCITDYVYNGRGLLTSLTNNWGSLGPLLSSFTNITYDALGNRLSLTVNQSRPKIDPNDPGGNAPDLSGAIAYSYDSQDRLASELRTFFAYPTLNYSHSFASDGADNFTTVRGGSSRAATLTYDADNRIASDNTSSYTYNANGNPTNYQGTTFGYDGEDRVTSITGMLNAAYKGDGQRAWKQGTNGQIRLYYLYDGDHVLAEINSAGKIIRLYGYGAAGLVQRYTTPDDASIPNDYFTYSFDPLGNLAGRHKKTGTGNPNVYEISVSAYDALGFLIVDASTISGGNYPVNDPIGGQGQQGAYTDEETRPSGSATGLALLASAYYDASRARYLNRFGGGFNEYQAATLPYRVFSNVAKGFLNAGAESVSSLVDLSAKVLTLGQAKWRVADKWRHPFQIGNRPEERAAGITGEGTHFISGMYFAGTAAIRGVSAAATASGEVRGLLSKAPRNKVSSEQIASDHQVPYEAEREFRKVMESEGVIIAPKVGGNVGGPDVVRTGGSNHGWEFAELKPFNKNGIGQGGSQVRKRLRGGWTGPGALYLYENPAPGVFVFRLKKIFR